ncbi:MAG: ABC transporter permease [Treponema sp.]|jgi:ABC-2 type transport system permease protein|nr:ABC transporter permease [Treponema sp.]
MNQFFKVLRFSYLAQMKNKGFIASTIIMAVIIMAGISIPSIINLFQDNTNDASPSQGGVEETGDEKQNIVVVDPQHLFFPDTDDLEVMFPGYIWSFGASTQDELTARVENDDIAGALIVQDDMTATYIYKTDINVFGSNIASQIRQYMSDVHRYKLLADYNVNETDAARFFIVPVLNEVNAGIINIVGQVQGMAFIVLLYITILTCGQMVAMSVIQEKSSRAMEILITTSRPETLIFGKVIGIGLAGLTQIVANILIGIVFYFINQKSLMSMDMLSMFFKVPVSTFVYVFIFFIGGFFFYAMLFGSLGSLVSRMEDMSSSQLPMMLFTIAGFFIALYGQMYGFADSAFYAVCSYIPFTSPYVMLARVCGEPNIPLWQVFLSIGILYVSTGLAGVFSAKIYRIGVLMYGKPPSVKEVFAALKQS